MRGNNFMKNKAALLTGKKGFTLIELLIVIALLGALAVGLLATIDPFEQLKKGRDTSLRNTVSEFYNANLRFYSTKGDFPWRSGTSTENQTATQVSSMGGYVTDLVNAGELKNRFYDLAGSDNLARVFVTSTTAEQLAVCYVPESKGFQAEPATQYSSDGSVRAAGCASQVSGGSSCAFCVQ